MNAQETLTKKIIKAAIGHSRVAIAQELDYNVHTIRHVLRGAKPLSKCLGYKLGNYFALKITNAEAKWLSEYAQWLAK